MCITPRKGRQRVKRIQREKRRNWYFSEYNFQSFIDQEKQQTKAVDMIWLSYIKTKVSSSDVFRGSRDSRNKCKNDTAEKVGLSAYVWNYWNRQSKSSAITFD